MSKVKRFYDFEPIFHQLDLFFSYKGKNAWIYDNKVDPVLSIYVRKAFHRADGQVYEFLDLASINIDKSRQGEGIFTNFMENLLKKYPSTNIYVESILNPSVRHICNKFGFKNVDADNMFLIRN